jgi:hypothetical protein
MSSGSWTGVRIRGPTIIIFDIRWVPLYILSGDGVIVIRPYFPAAHRDLAQGKRPLNYYANCLFVIPCLTRNPVFLNGSGYRLSPV